MSSRGYVKENIMEIGKYYKRVSGGGSNFKVGKKYRLLTVDSRLRGGLFEGEKGNASGSFAFFSKESPNVKGVSGDNEYSFSLTNKNLLNLAEVEKSLSRKNPVAIVHRSDKMHTVLIHHSLVRKVHLVSKELRDEYYEALEPYDKVFVKNSDRTLQRVIKVLKDIKKAPCVVDKGSVEIKVKLISL